MEDRIVSNYERFLTTAVDNIEHVESQTVAGRSVIKIFFQPGADIRMAMSQVTATSADRFSAACHPGSPRP